MSHSDEFPLEPHDCYHLTFNIVDWTDIFVKPVFKRIIVESLNYFVERKGLTIYGWCLMTNHLHLIAQAQPGFNLSLLAHDFKKFTSKIILEDIEAEPEVRRHWILKKFREVGRPLQRIDKFKVWQTGNNPVHISLENTDMLNENLELIHNMPVRDRIVSRPEDYLHCSARDYAGIKGLVNIYMLQDVDESNYILQRRSHDHVSKLPNR
jgi:REP element-mobilizing transposase RayT